VKHLTELAGILLALRAVLAGTLAFALAYLLRLEHPVYSFIAAVLTASFRR